MHFLSPFLLLVLPLPLWIHAQAPSSLPALSNGDGNSSADISQPVDGDEARLLDGLLPLDPVPLCRTTPPNLNLTTPEDPKIITMAQYQFVISDYSEPWIAFQAV